MGQGKVFDLRLIKCGKSCNTDSAGWGKLHIAMGWNTDGESDVGGRTWLGLGIDFTWKRSLHQKRLGGSRSRQCQEGGLGARQILDQVNQPVRFKSAQCVIRAEFSNVR